MNARTFALTSEKGQAIVLIVVAIIAVFGFAALAVDGGQILLAYRSAQTAADSAAMAAAYEAAGASGESATAINKGYSKAAENGYNNDKVTNWVEVNNPPIGGAYCGICGNPQGKEYYQVKISVRLSPVFAQLIFKGAEKVSVVATAHAKTAGGLSQGDALLSLSGSSDSMNFNGTTKVAVSNANVRSNGGMVKDGSSGAIEVLSPGKIYYATQFTMNGGKSPFTKAQPQKGYRALINAVPAPPCPSKKELATWTSNGSFSTKKINGLNYYYYPSGLSVSSLPAGIHCVDGGIGKGVYTGKNILIVLLSGGIDQTGNDGLDIWSATNMVDYNGNQWGGMVFYAPSSNKETLKFGGNSGAHFQGTVFAPGATCDVGGTEDGSGENTAFICSTIKFHGTPNLNITFRPGELYQVPPTVDLVE